MLSSSISCTSVCGWVRCSVCFVQRMFWGHTLKERGIFATRTSWLGPCLSYWDAVPPLERVERLARVDWAPGFLMRCSFTTWTSRTTRASWVGPCLNEMQRQVTLSFYVTEKYHITTWTNRTTCNHCFTTRTTGTSESPLSRLEKVVSIGHAWCF